MEPTNTDNGALTHYRSVVPHVKELSEQQEEERLESESIASALDGPIDEPRLVVDDLEKATTQGTHSSHETVVRITTAIDWTGKSAGLV